MNEGIKIEGTLLEFEEKTLGNKQAYSVKIDNHLMTWWEMTAAKEFAAKNPLNKTVVCVYTEKPNPKKPQYPYKNVKEITFPKKLEIVAGEGAEILEEPVGEPTSPDEPKGEGTHWKSKSIFLEKKTGAEIVEKQNEINLEEGKFIVATQIFKRRTSLITEQGATGVDLTDERGHTLYDAFIYYKESPFSNIKK